MAIVNDHYTDNSQRSGGRDNVSAFVMLRRQKMRKHTTKRVGDLSFSIFQHDVRLRKKEGGVGQTMQSTEDVKQAIH